MIFLIIEAKSDREKIEVFRNCLNETKDRRHKIIILASLVILSAFYISFSTLYPEMFLTYLYPLLSLIFLIPMAISVFFGETLSESLVVDKYYIVVKEGYLHVRAVSIVNTESYFSHPVIDLVGVGLGEKKIVVRCGTHKIELESKVIELFAQNGRKVFEFGFWLHEDDVVRIQEELAVNIRLMKARMEKT